MKIRFELYILVMLISGIAKLQAQQVVSALGGDAPGSGGSVSYSVGQVFCSSYSGTSGSVTEGVEQPYVISAVSGVNTVNDISFSIDVFPNPTSGVLTLRADLFHPAGVQLMYFQLYDLHGKLLESQNITGRETAINMNDFIPGTYFLKVLRKKRTSRETIKTFKITKN